MNSISGMFAKAILYGVKRAVLFLIEDAYESLQAKYEKAKEELLSKYEKQKKVG